MLLDYSSWNESHEFASLNGRFPKGDRSLLFENREICPFCRIPNATAFFQSEPNFVTIGEGTNDIVSARTCKQCGWWEVEKQHYRDCLDGFDTVSKTLKRAVLKPFREDDPALPLSLLRQELNKRAHLMQEIHPRKMEELVQSILRDCLSCEVHHCGRSGDEGIDLLVALSDAPMAIQVKRRTNAKQAESVNPVREFLGALVVKGIAKGMFVTSADRFAPAAHKFAKEAVERNAVTQFDLINGNRLLEMLRLVETEHREHWHSHIYIGALVTSCSPTTL
jgi:hypothetical protein